MANTGANTGTNPTTLARGAIRLREVFDNKAMPAAEPVTSGETA